MAVNRRRLTKQILFVLIVFLPTLAAGIYYFKFASDIYVSESKFVVRSANEQSVSDITSFLQGAGLGSSSGDSFSVLHYITSRDALKVLNKDDSFRASVSKASIDRLSRFNGLGGDDSFEALFEYYLDRVEVIMDGDSSIMTLKVRMFDPQEAAKINRELIQMSEVLVNGMSERSRRDMINFAEAEVDRAFAKARQASLAVSEYRDSKSMFDPTAQSSMQLQLVSKLQDEMISAKARLNQTKYLAPSSPQVEYLEREIANLQKQIDVETAKVAGGDESFSKKTTQYEQFMLDSEVAKQHLALAITTLENAHAQAIKQALYLQIVSRPSLPDSATEPDRMEKTLVVFILAFITWGIICMLIAGVREHYD